MKKICIIMLACTGFAAYGQWDDGILINVQEVNIARMQEQRMPGAEAVLKVIEQYVDQSYRYVWVSQNYELPREQQEYLKLGAGRFLVVVAGYPGRNNLLYAQIFYGLHFFFVIMAKREGDLIRTSDIQIYRMAYEKYNQQRRNNVRDMIQRNNIIPLGIDGW
jgi:hypothetical protein